MKDEKGLCPTCSHEKSCTLATKLPVWHCEEFTTGRAKSAEPKPGRKNRAK